MRIYVASSWRNAHQQAVVEMLRTAGHEVYDFRHPDAQGPKGAPSSGFAWSGIDPEWLTWDARRFRAALQDPIAQRGFAADHAAMEWADAFVLVLPSGRSAHLEMGWACGRGKRTIILCYEYNEPELMYLEADHVCVDIWEVLAVLETPCA